MELKDIYRKTEGALYNYRELSVEIQNMLIDIKEAETEYKGTGAISYQERTGPTNKTSDPTADEALNRRFTLDKMVSDLERKQRLKEKIDNALSTLDEGQKNIIELRCIKRLRWKEVEEIIGTDADYLMKIKKTAIEKLSSLIWQKEKYKITEK